MRSIDRPRIVRPLTESTSELELTQGKFAIVDNEDLPRLVKHNWIVMRNRYGWRAYAKINHRTVYMHRFILPHTMAETDHINHNSLDNRKINLRPASRSHNAANNYSVGVYKKRGKWSAQAERYGKRYSKTFESKEEAIEWRRTMKLELFGAGQ